MMRRKKTGYFEVGKNSPGPLIARIKRRVNFSEVDALGIVWHGRYAEYFEEAWAEFGRAYGLSYKNFYDARIKAPIVQFHIDYFQSLFLEEEFSIEARLTWSDGARLNMEYSLIKKDASIAATGYTVQMFINADTNEACFVCPGFIEDFRRRWKEGRVLCKK